MTLNLNLTHPPATNHTRYAYERCDGYHDSESLYDVVDLDQGSEKILAHRVRHEPARRIVAALNLLQE